MYIARNKLLMYHPGPLPVRVLPAPHECLERSTRISERADAVAGGVVGVDKGAVESDTRSAAVQEELIGLAGLERLVVEGHDFHALLNRGDAIVGVVWGLNWLVGCHRR